MQRYHSLGETQIVCGTPYKLIYSSDGIMFLIAFSLPISHFSFELRYLICGCHDNLSSMQTPKNFVSVTFLILLRPNTRLRESSAVLWSLPRGLKCI